MLMQKCPSGPVAAGLGLLRLSLPLLSSGHLLGRLVARPRSVPGSAAGELRCAAAAGAASDFPGLAARPNLGGAPGNGLADGTRPVPGAFGGGWWETARCGVA
ncbi:hypothetical protein GCM10027570_01790 [Streptomonospora sediminis]